MTRRLLAAAVMAVSAALAACTNESYDSGDGEYSYLAAELVEAHTRADKSIDYADTDNGVRLTVGSATAPSWAAKADTAYRALLYYDARAVSSAGGEVQVMGISQVPVLHASPQPDAAHDVADPVDVESAWASKGGKYVNLCLLFKSGRSDAADSVHKIGLKNCGTAVNADNTTTVTVRLQHDQGSVPQYYTVRQYVSIDTRQLTADSVTVAVATSAGDFTRTYPLRH